MHASKSKVTRKKVSDIVRLIVPVFFDEDETIGNLTLKTSDIMNGAALYGDTSKREGLRHALAWADKKRKKTRIVEMVVGLNGKHAHGATRMDEDMLLSGEYGIIRFEKYAIKIDLYEKVSAAIEKEAARMYPRARRLTSEEWLIFDPSIARVLFTLYPVEVVIIDSTPPYTPKGKTVSTVVIRDPGSIAGLSMPYEPFKVTLSA